MSLIKKQKSPTMSSKKKSPFKIYLKNKVTKNINYRMNKYKKLLRLNSLD